MLDTSRGGMPRDVQKALKLYCLAAKAGDAIANFKLAELYERGDGVTKDRKLAWQHYVASANAGHALSHIYVGKLLVTGVPEAGQKKDYNEAKKWMMKGKNSIMTNAADLQSMMSMRNQEPDGISDDFARLLSELFFS